MMPHPDQNNKFIGYAVSKMFTSISLSRENSHSAHEMLISIL